jgi:hypothetical protein
MATATNAGTNYNIDWKNNGTFFGSTTVPQIVYTKTAGQDNITAEITSVDCNATALSDTAIVNEPTHAGNRTGLDNAISISPIPFKNTLTITGLEAGDNILLINSMGQVVVEERISSPTNAKTIELNPGSIGVYCLKIVGKTGKVKTTTLLQRQ